jgi:hypothetical protein
VSRRSRARVVVCDVAPPPVAGRVRSIDRSRASRVEPRRVDATHQSIDARGFDRRAAS